MSLSLTKAFSMAAFRAVIRLILLLTVILLIIMELLILLIICDCCSKMVWRRKTSWHQSWRCRLLLFSPARAQSTAGRFCQILPSCSIWDPIQCVKQVRTGCASASVALSMVIGFTYQGLFKLSNELLHHIQSILCRTRTYTEQTSLKQILPKSCVVGSVIVCFVGLS